MKQGGFNKLSEVLGGNNQLIIPDLQRDYCWGTIFPEGQSNSLVYNFTAELIALSKRVGENRHSEISYGIIYTYEHPQTFFYLCDGQQRLTTLYLIIAVLAEYVENETLKELLILDNRQARIKYEVRNSTDYFINDLVHGLKSTDQKGLTDVSKEPWFRKEFEDDPSIKSMIEALKTIKSLISKKDAALLTEVILNNIGFVYVNLKGNESIDGQVFSRVREYGEKMYEIVNTSGDPMERNEHLKAVLLAKVSEGEKEMWTEKWELWQDFFWNCKDKGHDSADEGFDEFLSWIEKLKGKEKKIDSVQEVEQYFKAYYLIFNLQNDLLNYRHFNILNIKEVLHQKDSSKLVVILPALVYLKSTSLVSYNGNAYEVNRSEVNFDALFRFLRFFSNVAKYSQAGSAAAALASKLNENEDVTKFIKFSKKFPDLISDEELYKLELYKSANESSRVELENLFWNAEDYNFMNGKIDPIFKWLKVEYNVEIKKDFETKKFNNFFKTLKDLTSEANIKKLRHALLAVTTNWDVFAEGWSWGVKRFYLGRYNDLKYWRKIVIIPEFGLIMEKGSENKLDYDFFSESIKKNEKVEHRKAYRKLIKLPDDFWQWENNHRFFIKDKVLYIPNGVQAKSYTAEIPL